MGSSTRHNAVYGIDSSVTRYAEVDNGSCRCNSRNSQHEHDDHELGKDIFTTSRNTKLNVHARKITNISIIAKSKSSDSFLKENGEKRDNKPRGYRRAGMRRRLNADEKEEGMKMNRLLLLLAVFVIYVSLGAVAFNVLEAGAEQSRKDELDSFVHQFLVKYSCVNRTDLYHLLKKSVVDSEIVNYVVENKTHLDRWDFSGAFGFVVSVVTTIGFGNMSPVTPEGKLVCVLYALFGIPLTLLVLGGLGEKMATCVTHIKRCRNPMCHQTPRVNRMMNISYIIILGVVLIFLAPAAMFTYVEQWHFMESVYFCFTTLSTIGFGDYVIGIHETRLTNVYAHEIYEVVAYVWILLGLAYLSLVYRYITDTMVAKAQVMAMPTIRNLGRDSCKTVNTTTTTCPDSPSSSKSSSPDRRSQRNSSVHTEDICDIELPVQIPKSQNGVF